MPLPEVLGCPLCDGVKLRPLGRLRFECPAHGGFVLLGEEDRDPGRIAVRLERWSTGLRYDVGFCSPDEWHRMARSEP